MAVWLAMAAGPDQVGRLVLCDHSQPICTLPCLSSVIKVFVSSWSFSLVLSAWFPFPTLGGQPVLVPLGPRPGSLERLRDPRAPLYGLSTHKETSPLHHSGIRAPWS